MIERSYGWQIRTASGAAPERHKEMAFLKLFYLFIFLIIITFLHDGYKT